LTFERSTDYALLTSMLRNPSLFPFLGDDFSPPIAEACVVEFPGLWYILARDEGVPFGFWMCEPRSPILFEFHTVMPLDARALAAMKALLGPDGWLWANTECRRAVTYVAATNRIAFRFAIRAGLTIYGTNPMSYLLHGTLTDQILFGISKAEAQ
jgi:hypothetical protein